jgi:hypothetical protein
MKAFGLGNRENRVVIYCNEKKEETSHAGEKKRIDIQVKKNK